ncbi:MAG TPA: hypothetical protein PLZ36_00230 [Armatimonadota bacterium]|nr:hypothetical protein [Armatimonadota bacterium]
MRGLLTWCTLCIGLALAALPAAAQGVPCEDAGDCAADPGPQARAYKKELLFMSPVGYVRWVHFMETKVWLTLEEAAKLLAERGLPDQPA